MTDPFIIFDVLTQTQLGKLFGVSSHTIGRWLKEVGLRRPDGEPTQKAIDGGIAVSVTLDGDAHSFWGWAKGPTIRILEAAGHQLVSTTAVPSSPPQTSNPLPDNLTGPFSAKSNGGDGFAIEDANGIAGYWTRGEKRTKKLVEILNYFHDKGVEL